MKDAGNAEASAKWTDWIHVEAQLDGANKVKNWKNSLKKLIIDKVSVKDESDYDVKLYESSTATERKYTVVGIAFKGDGSVGSAGWKNQILDGEDYQYTVNEDGKDKVISVFPVIKPEIEYLDLSGWGKLFYEGSYYFSGMESLKFDFVCIFISDTLSSLLSRGYNVTLDDIGTFSMSLKFIDEKSTEIQEEDDRLLYRRVGVKDINFKTSPEMLHELRRVTKFERSQYAHRQHWSGIPQNMDKTQEG